VSHGWLVCERTRSTAAELQVVLRNAVAAEDLQLRVMALHLIEGGGKRLRPLLLLLAASFGRASRDRLLRAAAALELVHVASLYHDDVMDRAPLRRSAPSTNARWGNMSAALAGTYLFARASALLASLGDAANRLASEASVTLCIGQLREVENAFNPGLAEEEHLEILRQKTAALFELPCRLGALLAATSPDHAAALASYGRSLGLAFQLVDDALDLTAEAPALGKATGNDIREGVYSLAVLRALRRPDPPGPELRALLSLAKPGAGDLERTLHLVRESGAVAEVLELARHHAAAASAALEALPDGPARRSLVRLAESAPSRSR
jgi:geranylgeranyl pyrophosphate synthase